MKKIKFLAMMLAAGMMAACSDSLEETTGGNGNQNTSGTTEGYVKVVINMPTTSGASTRAETNDQFNNGIADEYAVGQDNWIVFFSGNDEGSATIAGFSNLTSLGFSNANEDPSNITTTSTAVVEKVPLNTKYALVVLNANGIITQEQVGTGDQTTSKLKVNNTEVTNLAGFTKALKNQEVSNYIKGNNNKYFLMSNAPIAKVGGGDSNLSTGQNVTTLVEVTVYPDEETAQNSPANKIYVERAVAKVTISNTFPKTIDVEDNNPLDGSPVELVAWTLDNTNKSTKIVRDVTGWNSWVNIKNTTSDKSTNRFFGTTPDPYRVYWAVDDNYTETNASTDLNNITAGTTSTEGWNTSIVNGENPIAAYCFENTFVANRDNEELDAENKATRVLFKVKVTPNIKEDGTAASDIDTKASDFILFGNTTAVYTKTTFLEYVKAYILPDAEEVEINSDLEDGAVFTTKESLYTSTKEQPALFSKGVNATNAEEVFNALGQNVRFYGNGIMFFDAATIKHFGEEYTALKADNAALSENESYLGRYGVVRNNWYELNVTKVGIGSPVIPDDDENLDEKEAYINCEINVLSWAKRSQDVEL